MCQIDQRGSTASFVLRELFAKKSWWGSVPPSYKWRVNPITGEGGRIAPPPVFFWSVPETVWASAMKLEDFSLSCIEHVVSKF